MSRKKTEGTKKPAYRAVEFSYRRLRGRIVERFVSQARFAKAMGMTSQMLSARLTGRSAFTVGEVWYACKMLGIGDADIGHYFFCLEEKEASHHGG